MKLFNQSTIVFTPTVNILRLSLFAKLFCLNLFYDQLLCNISFNIRNSKKLEEHDVWFYHLIKFIAKSGFH